MIPVAIYTLGCKLNQLESEAIADAFNKAGFQLCSQDTVMEGQGLIIINTCTVTSKADQKARHTIRRTLKENPLACVIVTGCYAQMNHGDIISIGDEFFENGNGCAGEADHFYRLFVLGNNIGGSPTGPDKSSLLDLPDFILESQDFLLSDGLLSKVLEKWLSNTSGDQPFSFKPETFAFHSRGYLKIQDGCNNNCTYCRTRLARGPSVSMPAKEALTQLCSLEAKGVPELMITGVNITQYQDSGLDLAGLLECLLESSKTIALRLSSLEPEAVTEKLVSVLGHPRIRPHFHLSVQSGSDAILQAMGRAYLSQSVENAAALLRSVKNDPFLACDIIAGFPGETESDFAQTIALCEKLHFAWIHAFPYSRRPGTVAFDFYNSVRDHDISHRIGLLVQLAQRGRREYASGWLGREISAIVEKSHRSAGLRFNGLVKAGQCRAVSDNYLKLLVNNAHEAPSPGSLLRCIPISLYKGESGKAPDLIADMVW
jgi:threonylcarbamoyladenosine tRNA methylthiotransferase MtaB